MVSISLSVVLYRYSVSDKTLPPNNTGFSFPLTSYQRTCPMALLLASDIKVNGFLKLG